MMVKAAGSGLMDTDVLVVEEIEATISLMVPPTSPCMDNTIPLVSLDHL